MSQPQGPIYGIDLGTTFARVASVDGQGRPAVVPNAEGEARTPAVVRFGGDRPLVGSAARAAASHSPDGVVERVRRSMGDPNYLFSHSGRDHRPEDISALILRKVAGDAERSLAQAVRDVVIACPAYFGRGEREATARAGGIAGLRVRAILDEPTAAALAYGLDRGGDQVVLIYDLGGETFAVTVLAVAAGAVAVLGTGEDPELGGRGWDHDLVRHLAEQYRQKTGRADLLDDPAATNELFARAEAARHELSRQERVRVVVRGVPVEVARAAFEGLTAPRFRRTLALTRGMLLELKATKGHSQFGRILLVGGATRMPHVAAGLRREFGVPVESRDPDEAVAKGAAQYGWKLRHGKIGADAGAVSQAPPVAHAPPAEPARGPERPARPAPAAPLPVVLSWVLRRRRLWRRQAEAVVTWEGGPAELPWLRVVGKQNEPPANADDGRCLGEWSPPPGGPPCSEIRLPLRDWPDAVGEVFCRLFPGATGFEVLPPPLAADTIL